MKLSRPNTAPLDFGGIQKITACRGYSIPGGTCQSAAMRLAGGNELDTYAVTGHSGIGGDLSPPPAAHPAHINGQPPAFASVNPSGFRSVGLIQGVFKVVTLRSRGGGLVVGECGGLGPTQYAAPSGELENKPHPKCSFSVSGSLCGTNSMPGGEPLGP